MLARLFLLVAIVVAAGACSREKEVKCSAGTRYLAAQSAGLLRVPDDLSVPEQSEALNIPAPTPPRETDANSAACLEFSPAYTAPE
jgi:uncharacterized lipoprotein